MPTARRARDSDVQWAAGVQQITVYPDLAYKQDGILLDINPLP